MQLSSTNRLRWIWIAMFAILMNALAPSISHAVASSKGQPRTWEICLSDGTRVSGVGELDYNTFIAVTDRSKTGQQPAMQMDMDDCGYCLPHGGSSGAPPVALAPLAIADGTPLRPFLFYRSPQPLAVWSAANPRGPPANS